MKRRVGWRHRQAFDQAMQSLDFARQRAEGNARRAQALENARQSLIWLKNDGAPDDLCEELAWHIIEVASR